MEVGGDLPPPWEVAGPEHGHVGRALDDRLKLGVSRFGCPSQPGIEEVLSTMAVGRDAVEPHLGDVQSCLVGERERECPTRLDRLGDRSVRASDRRRRPDARRLIHGMYREVAAVDPCGCPCALQQDVDGVRPPIRHRQRAQGEACFDPCQVPERLVAISVALDQLERSTVQPLGLDGVLSLDFERGGLGRRRHGQQWVIVDGEPRQHRAPT